MIKEETKTNSIPPYILESISSLNPENLIHSESCPPYPLEAFDIQEKLDENYKRRQREKETEYKIGNYLIKKTLGQGTFGKVKLGIYLPTQEKVAIKILEKDRIIEKDDEIRVKREFDMLAKFNHPNVILVAEIFESSDSYYSVMEYCEGGELFNYIVKNRRLSEEEAAFFYYQLINGLEYIHSLGIVHRDLKPENLLLTSEHLLKIIDFGLSNYFKIGQKNLLSTPCGSPCYASPEMVGGKKYDGFKIDIWSSGIILYAMLCGYLPFEDKDNDILFEKILECKLIFPKYITNIAKDLMEKILVTDPDLRINISEIKKHPFYLKGKELFEQEFSVYQITRDANDKASFVENIDLNQILDNPLLNEINKDKNTQNKEEMIDNKENIDININEDSLNENKNIKDNKNKDKIKEKENKDINEIPKIKEIEIENKEIKKDEKNENEKEKEKEFLDEKMNSDRKKDNENKRYEIVLETINQEISKENEDKNKKNPPKEILNSVERETKEDSTKIQDINSIKQNKLKDINKNSKNNSKNKINNNIIINTTTKKNDNFKSKDKIVTLIKDKDNHNNIRRKLIKNNHKLNIREKTRSRRAIKSTKKPNKIINYNNFKKRKYMEITPNLKNLKYNSKKLIKKRINNSKILRKKFSSKGNINKQKLIYKKNNIYSNNINNTIDDNEMPKKYILHFNFHKLNLSSMKGSKRASSVAKNNMKLNSFETSKAKNDKKNIDNIYDINSSVKKNNKIVNNIKKYGIKFNLLHKKDLKEINRNFKNKRNNNYLKTEISKDKGKNILQLKGIQKMKLPNINIDNITNGNNSNIKIIDNTKEENNNNFDKNKNKNYNIKTNIKKINNNKLFQKANDKGNSEYIIRTFDKEKHDSFFKQNLNKYSKISGNLNKNYLKNLEHKNTIDVDDKIHRINIDISTNLGCIKNNNTNNNNEHYNSKKKNNMLDKKRTRAVKSDISKNENIYINIDLNNKKLIHKDNLNDKNYNLKEIDNVIKTEPSKKPSISSNSNLINTEDSKEDKNKLLQIKITPINPVKISNYRKNQKNHKRYNIPKNLNKSSNGSIFNSLLKNPFIPVDSTNFNTINQNSNNTNIQLGANNINKKMNNNKNSHKTINNSKKKPCVTIRNTVINFNMIDSGFILESLNKKKEIKKKSSMIGTNNSVNKLQNNHLYGLCNKFNNNLMPNINNNNIQGDISIRTKTINVNSNNNNMHFNSKKLLNYGDKYMKHFKKISNIKTKKFINNHDKIHMKFNSMRLEDFNGLKTKKKNLNNININKIGNLNNNKLINNQQKYFNTINNEEIIHSNENNNNYNNSNRK